MYLCDYYRVISRVISYSNRIRGYSDILDMDRGGMHQDEWRHDDKANVHIKEITFS